jgi:hypothetical protein
MTQKEKAQELVDKYRTYIRAADKYEYLDPEDEVHLAKQCALVAVNEILIENSKRGGENDEITEYEPYWQEVQQQLSKL